MIKYNGKIKIFIDSSSISEIKKYRKKFKISGITTNPSIMKNDGVKNYFSHCKKISKTFKSIPVSFEILSDDFNEIYTQSIKINSISSNVYVKIPIVNSTGKSNLKIIRKLLDLKIKINVTAILDKKQIYKLNEIVTSQDKVIISIFAGRIADTLRNPNSYIIYAKKLFKNKKNSKILWASCREILNIKQADKINCDIITISPSILSKLKLNSKNLIQVSKETSLMFYKDALKANFKI